MFKYIVKQLRRSAVTNALFCLLLTLAGTLLCISAGLWYSAHKSLLDINETITTIAIPNRVAINRLANEILAERPPGEPEEEVIAAYEINGQWVYEYAVHDPVQEVEREILQTIREEIYPSGLFQMDERRFFNAFAEGINPIPLRLTGVGAEPYYAAHSGQALAAFLVTCEMISSDYYLANDPTWHGWYDYDVKEDPYVSSSFGSARFSVNEIILLHHAHPEPRYIQIHFSYLNHDGSPMFEPGKQYVVFGEYERQMGMGMSSLTLDPPDVFIETESVVVGLIASNDDLNDLLGMTMWGYHLEDKYFPMEIREFRLTRAPTADEKWYSFIEIESSLEETMASEKWKSMAELLENAKISSDSFQILTTNDPNSLFRFNQNRNLFDEGRTFSNSEVRGGIRVCLISREFAEHNELSVGDTLPLQFYNSVLGAIDVTYMVSDGIMDTELFWIPSIYQTGLEISEPVEYEIIGIYNSLRFDRSEYAIPPNTVIIPNNSLGELSGEPVSNFDASVPAPILLNSMIVPNGRISETRAQIESIAPGYGGLFRFYDQGYDSLRTTLGNLRFGMAWIMVITAAGWIAVLFIFLMFYVTRKRKDAALLYGLGVSRSARFGWVFTQCAALILIAMGLSVAAALPVYGDILDVAAGVAQEFTDSFRNLTLSVAADSGLRSRIPLDRSPLALIVTIAGASVITLIAAGFLTSRSAAFKSLSEKGGEE